MDEYSCRGTHTPVSSRQYKLLSPYKRGANSLHPAGLTKEKVRCPQLADMSLPHRYGLLYEMGIILGSCP